MNLNEVRRIISNSEITEVLNQHQFKISFPSTNDLHTFKGLFNLYKFIKEQKDQWELISESSTNNSLKISKIFFNNALPQLDRLLTSIEAKLITETGIKSEFSHLNQFLTPSSQIFTFDSPEVTFLTDLLEKDPLSFDSAFQYITAFPVSFNTKKNIKGVLLAYEFQNKDISHIFNRRETEKKSLFTIRKQIDNTANEYENILTEHIKQTTIDYQDYKSKLDDFEQRSEESLSQWMITHKGDFETFHTESIEKVTALENQYSELLKLKEPVKYWSERAIQLRNTGYGIFVGVIISSFLLAYFIYQLLWLTPEGMLESIFSGDKTSAIRWSIVFILFVSLFFVIIRSLMKFMFSNFHLARDAEEREKLTYMYLALISNGEFNEEERKIVLQSLFSRSDTGLLKEDSSPTMPGINTFIDKMK